jgi:predicted amidohydrolase YtcJ
MKKLFYLFLLSSSFCKLSFSQKIKAETLYKNGVIYTVNGKFDVTESFIVDKGKFVTTGKTADLLTKFDPKNTVDLKGKAVYPGFIDPHAHFVGLSQMLGQCDLTGTKSFEEILNRLKEFDKNHPENKWLIGRGWDQNDWENKSFPTKDGLDQLFANKAVMLTRVDGHAMLVNSKAIQEAKISPNAKITSGQVEILDGQLTGILIDNAMNLIKRVMPVADEIEKRKLILEAQKECFKYGLTTVSDAGINQDDIELLMQMHLEKSLKIRDYAMVSIGLRNIEYFTKKGIIKTPKMNVRSFKLYADGALGSRGAALLEPYTDDLKNQGLMILSEKELDNYFAQIIKSDFQANTHCIGDRANQIVLDLYGKYLKGKNAKRWRIEHCQVVSKADVPKFGKYSVIPSVQTTHGTSDMYWAEARLGKNRVQTAYAFKDLLKQNGMIANGSDYPVEFVNPIYGFHSAFARQDAKNWPNDGFQMENALTRTEALKAMTIWAAYANFEEAEKGSIEKGKFADFVILENDIMKIEPSKVRETKVLSTYIDGVKVN